MRWKTPLLIFVLAVATAGIAVTANFLMHPFADQSAAGLRAAMLLRVWGPWVGALLVAAGAVLLLRGWRGAGAVSRALALLACAALVGGFVFLRTNVFEQMFEPIEQPSFSLSEHVGSGEMVLGVAAGGEAKAYPVRVLAYHHLVNDVVGGSELVATY